MTPAEQQAVRNILAELRLTRERVRHLEDRIGDLIDTYDTRINTKNKVIDDLRRRLDYQKRQTRKANTLLKNANSKTTELHGLLIRNGVEVPSR